MDAVYEQLRIRLDEMATGYPATEGGVELRLLEKLFTPGDARLFLLMPDIPATPAEVALLAGRDPSETSKHLEDMAHRGLLFRFRGSNGPTYLALPFIVGIYEFQVNALNSDIVKDLSEYYLSGLGRSFHSTRVPHLRTIPVETGMVSSWPIAPYDHAVEIVQGKGRIAVAECLCRKAIRMYSGGCEHPLETCLQFDAFADYYVDNGMARQISTDEALDILRVNEKAGLVFQALNSREVEALCACCSCCCGMIIALKLFPVLSREVRNNYICALDPEPCSGCGACAGRCPVDAVILKEGDPHYREERCIGCGLCVTTCPEKARALVKKPQDKLYQPPETVYDTMTQMGIERGKKRDR